MLEGKTVKEVRLMTAKEKRDNAWSASPVVIVFTDGTIIFPSRDPEGNGPGALFGRDKEGEFQLHLRQ